MTKKTKTTHGRKEAEKNQAKKQDEISRLPKWWTHTAVGYFVLAVVLGVSSSSMFKGRNQPGTKEEALIHWIRSNGGYVHQKLEIRNVEGLWGMYVDADLQPHESFLDVPDSCFFSTKAVREKRTLISQVVPTEDDVSFLQPLLPQMQLAVALMVESRYDQSFWRPWLDWLPKEYPHQPLFWDDQQLQELQSPMVQAQIEQSKRHLRSKLPMLRTLATRYAQLGLTDDNDEELFQHFLWAYHSVMSRSVEVFGDVPSDGKSNQFATGLVPLMDLLKHDFGSPTIQKSLTVSPSRDVSYYTGLALTKLPANTELTCKCHTTDAPSTFTLMRHGMVDSDLERGDANFIILKLFNTRWTVASSGRMLGLKSKDGDRSELVNDLVPKVEKAILGLPTSLVQDQGTLLGLSADVSLRTALLLRMRYKTILYNLLAWLKAGARDPPKQYEQNLEHSPSLALIEVDISDELPPIFMEKMIQNQIARQRQFTGQH